MRAQRDPRLQLESDEVIKGAPLGVARPGHRQHVLAQPVPQEPDIVRQRDGRVAGGAGPPRSLGDALRRPGSPSLSRLLAFQSCARPSRAS